MDKDTYVNFRTTHTIKETQQHFGLNYPKVKNLDVQYNIDSESLKRLAIEKRVAGYRKYIESQTAEEREASSRANSARVHAYFESHPEAKEQISLKMKQYAASHHEELKS